MTKVRRLLEVDLARLTTLPLDEQRRRMERLAGGGMRLSLEPMRAQFGDIMNVQPPMFETLGAVKPTSFSVIEKELAKRCKAGKELEINVDCARHLHNHYMGLKVVSRAQDFGSFPLGLDRGVRYWVRAFYGRSGRPVLTFIDPRGGSLRLTGAGREVVFSAMHAGVRERNADFADAILEIVQLPYVEMPDAREYENSDRTVRVYSVEGDVRYTFEELDRKFTATLRLWDEVCESVTAVSRRQASGGRGDLL